MAGVQAMQRVMGGLQRETAAGGAMGDGAAGDVDCEGVAGAGLHIGAVGDVDGAAGDGTGNGDSGVVDGEGVTGDVPLVLPVGRVLQVMQWVVVSLVVPMVRVPQVMHRVMPPPFVSIVRVLHRVVVRLVCAAGGAMGGDEAGGAYPNKGETKLSSQPEPCRGKVHTTKSIPQAEPVFHSFLHL